MPEHPALDNLASWLLEIDNSLGAIATVVTRGADERAILSNRFVAVDKRVADLEATARDLAALETRVAALETGAPPPVDPPPVDPPPSDLKIWRLPTGNGTGVMWNTSDVEREIRSRVGGGRNGGWVDYCEGVEFTGDGGVVFHADPAKRRTSPQNTGGANWFNAWMPLEYPGTDVEIRYRMTCPTDFGRSMKTPGLGRSTGGQRSPGGGYCGDKQCIVRPSLSDWNRDDKAWFGPYSYWPFKADAGSEKVHTANGRNVRLWHPPRPRADESPWCLWWYGDTEVVLTPKKVVDVSLRVMRTENSWNVMQQVDDRLITFEYKRHPNEPTVIDHLSFVCMYGGDTAEYGPDEPTVTRFDDLQVITRP